MVQQNSNINHYTTYIGTRMIMNNKKKKRPERVPLTVFVMPDINVKPYHLSISKKTLRGSLGITTALVLAFVILTAMYLIGLNDVRNVQKIKQENREKEASMQQMNMEMEEIQKRQEQINLKQQEIKKLMGLQNETPEPATPSRGSQKVKERVANKDEQAGTDIRAQDIKTVLSQDEKELEEMLTKVKKDQAFYRAIPNQWPLRGEITSEFGIRRSPWGRNEVFHEGIDIKGAVGTDIVAAADGDVVSADWMPVYGKTVIINHGNGLESIYGHTSAMLVKKGDRVSKGEVIARVGTTGMSTGPHLHFGITKNGQLQDPMSYLP